MVGCAVCAPRITGSVEHGAQMTRSFEVADLKKVMPINQIEWSLMFLCEFQNSVLLIVFFSIF